MKIDSCLAQKGIRNEDIEIIIGDDGSNDGSIEVIKDYAYSHKNIQYFVMDRNNIENLIPSIRVSNIIKRAAKIAKGKYISCLSADDIFCDDHKFQKQVKYLEQHDGYIASASGYKLFWPDGRTQEIVAHSSFSKTGYWSGLYIHLSAFVFRKEVFEKKYMLKNFCDDTGLIYSLICMGKWNYIPEVTFAYRQRDKSIMHEADKLELNLIELSLFEDCMEIGKYRMSSAARFRRPYIYCFLHRKELSSPKYKKYVMLSNDHKYKVISNMAKFDELPLYKKVLLIFGKIITAASYNFFGAYRKIYRLLVHC